MGLQLKSYNLPQKWVEKCGGRERGKAYEGSKMHFGLKSSCTSGLQRGAEAISPRGRTHTGPAHVAQSRALTSRHDERAMGIRRWGLNGSVCQPRTCQAPTSGEWKRLGGSYSPLGPFRKTSSHGSSIQWPCGRATQTAVVFYVSFPPPLTVLALPSGLDASRICNHKGLLPFFSCLMKWQNNRFTYAETGVVTGLTPLDLKCVAWGKTGGKTRGGKVY